MPLEGMSRPGAKYQTGKLRQDMESQDWIGGSILVSLEIFHLFRTIILHRAESLLIAVTVLVLRNDITLDVQRSHNWTGGLEKRDEAVIKPSLQVKMHVFGPERLPIS